MEKILRRSILHRNQLVTKRRRESAKELRKEWREFNRYKNLQQTHLQRLVEKERIARREDWILGPLAPKRDAGLEEQTYGAVDTLAARAPSIPKREIRAPKGKGSDPRGSEDQRLPGPKKTRGEWEGEWLEGNLVSGDRVVVIKGRPGLVGKIGEITSIDQASRSVFVKHVNKTDMVVPPFHLTSPGAAKIFEQELPIPISDVRLVTQVTNEDGVSKDVIVRSVIGQAPYEQRSPGSNLPRHTRYIAGGYDGNSEDVEIPWPEEDPERFYTQTGDTTSDIVDNATYVPSLIRSLPLAKGAIDELRNPFSRTRREHDNVTMMRKKLLEDARKDWFAQRSEVLSSPFWTKEYMEKQAKKGTQGSGAQLKSS